MRLITLLVTLAICSCGNRFDKPPRIEICSLDPNNGVAYCSMTRRAKKKPVKLKRASIKPISEMNKYIAVSPTDWGIVVKYIKKLKSQVKRELKK